MDFLSRSDATLYLGHTRYDYHRADGLLLEGTINLVVTAPLLELMD